MGVNAFDDIVASARDTTRKVVIIYTTAGENHCGGSILNKLYYILRQAGANRSVQFCSDIYGKHGNLSSATVTIKGKTDHAVTEFKYKNVVSYFLRLPDGCFESSDKSLTKLASRKIATLETVDSSASYHGFDDLLKTVESIVMEEGTGTQDISINTHDWDKLQNPGDHPDHIETGLLASEIAARIPCVNLYLFEGYASNDKPANLSPGDVAKEAALLCQASFGQTHSGSGTEWDPENSNGHVDLTNRNYFRTFISCDRGSTGDKNKRTIFYADSADHLNKQFVKVFPNPAQNLLSVSYEIMDSGLVTIMIYDLFGNPHGVLVNEVKDKGVYTLDYNISGLKRGHYTLYAKTPQNVRALQFVKE